MEAGVLVLVDTRHGSSLALPPRRRLAPSMGLAPTLFPQTTGCFAIKLQKRLAGPKPVCAYEGPPSLKLWRAAFTCCAPAGEGWWEVLVTLQFVASDTYFMTSDLQSDSRITSREKVDG